MAFSIEKYWLLKEFCIVNMRVMHNAYMELYGTASSLRAENAMPSRMTLQIGSRSPMFSDILL